MKRSLQINTGSKIENIISGEKAVVIGFDSTGVWSVWVPERKITKTIKNSETLNWKIIK